MESTTFVHPDLAAAQMVETLGVLGLEFGAPRHLTRTVLDTFDGRLDAAGMCLQAVTSAGLHLQLDAPGSVPATVSIATTPRLAADLPAGPLGHRIAHAMSVRALLPVVTFTTSTTTAVERDRSGRTLALVTVTDCIDVGKNGHVPATLQLVAARGERSAARRLAERCVELGFVAVEGDLVDLVTAAAGVCRAGFRSEASVPLRTGMPAEAGFRAVCANLAASIDANWQGTIDDLDTEFLHELRVAVRRTRTLLGQSKRVLPNPMRSRFQDDFAWLAQSTSAVRDLDVYTLEWPGYVAAMSNADAGLLQPVLDHVVHHRAAARAELVAVLQSRRAHDLLDEWRAALAGENVGRATQAGSALGAVVAERFLQAHQTVLHHGRLIDETSPAEQLHDLRKDAKKLRYIIECFAGMLPGKVYKRYIRQLKGLQDNLGEHQDAEVHADELAAVAHELSAEHATPSTLLALGQLTERLAQSQREARHEFAGRFAEYDSVTTHRIVGGLVDALGQRDGGG